MNSTRPALLIVNGVLPDEARIRTLCDQAGSIVCTDGAADQLRAVAPDIMPDVIIGDLDSLQDTLSYRKSSVVQIEDQNSTDLEKALTYLIDRKFTSVIVVGFYGTRYDHTVTNLQILSAVHQKLSIILVDNLGYGVFLSHTSSRNSVVLEEAVGTTVSLIPLGKVVSGLRQMDYSILLMMRLLGGASGVDKVIKQTCRGHLLA